MLLYFIFILIYFNSFSVILIEQAIHTCPRASTSSLGEGPACPVTAPICQQFVSYNLIYYVIHILIKYTQVKDRIFMYFDKN